MSEQERQQHQQADLDPGERRYPPPSDFAQNANIQDPQIWQKAADDPEGFWESWAEQLHWFEKWDQVMDWNPPHVKWFTNGKINAAYNCLDYHIEQGRGDKTALIWEADEPGQGKSYTYNELLAEVNKAANMLKDLGVEPDDAVGIYLPMIPELVISMLACARIGAIHSVVFSAFAPPQLQERMEDAQAKVLITADTAPRGGQQTPLKENADEGLQENESVQTVVVVRRTGEDVPMTEGRDQYWDELVDNQSDECEPEQRDSEDILFVLYSSGSTGKPKGIIHTHGGYLAQLKATQMWVMDHKEDDVFWCTADIGWITGHSYLVYAPLLVGGTTLQFEGTPTYPESNRWFQVVEQHGVTQFYTAPTAVRSFMQVGVEEAIGDADISSIRWIGSVGEPINPAAWAWMHEVIGRNECPLVDTWWQTETGAVMIAPLPGISTLVPGSACEPFPGIFLDLWDE
ncbi:MAG TPA: AMP-binding protein, partial [Rubrobacteraceae bacterium]|nr:AMP-binding protein [Rubrobacteraceae bacterium]